MLQTFPAQRLVVPETFIPELNHHKKIISPWN